MRSHDHDADAVDSLRPRSARLEDDTTLHAQAASQGRWDAVRPDGFAQLQRSTGNAGLVAALQRAHDGHADGDHGDDQAEERSPVHDVVNSGGGRPLEPEVRTDMETRLGADFSDVRVHDDGRAHDSAKAVQANAYTVGSNVVFQRDGYDPSSDQGRLTLAHELTHVVQQRSGPVDGAPAAGGIRVSDPSDRFEREASANAERVMSAPAPAPDVAGPAPAAAAVQRQAADEDEEPGVQGSFVQREAEEEDEVQGSFEPGVQREAEEEDEVQGSFEPGVQRQEEDEQEDAAPA